MKIKPTIYENLTPRQRIIAVIEAQARKDDNEIQTLINTCPKKTYTWGDAEYSHTMQKLLIMTLLIESDMRGYALGVMACLMKDHDATEMFLQKMSDTQAAWEGTLKNMGINPETMQRANIGLENPMVNVLREILPEPDAEAVKNLHAHMEEYLFKTGASKIN